MKATLKRYDHVKTILSEAAGTHTGLYGGPLPFWELPYEDFLSCEVYGVRMIADGPSHPSPILPGKERGCCCSKNEPSVNTASNRGLDSGLIRGLKGLAPFDGKPFARLPWGGDEVAIADILFIQDWIDDGCPKDEIIQSVTLESNEPQAKNSSTQAKENVFIYQAQDGFLDQPGNKRVRMNLDCLSSGQLDIYRQALREMYALNKHKGDWRSYNSIALIHQNHCQHAWERFLPWHRVYLYEFERALNDIIGHSFGVPYWDWTMPQYQDGNLKGDIIPKSLKAFITETSVCELGGSGLTQVQLDALRRDIVGKLFTSQREFFEAVKIAIEEDPAPYRKCFIDALLAANALWYPLRYPAEFYKSKPGHPGEKIPSTIEQKVGYHYPSADDIAQIQSLATFRDYGGGSKYDNSYGFMDQNPHNTIHIWTGGQNPEWDGGKDGVVINGRNYHSREEFYTQPQYGDMFSNLTASFDPIFWPHHVNVDRLWTEWQEANPHSNPADSSAILTPWNYNVGDTMDHSKFGYEYLKSCFRFPVGMGEPIHRFVSQKTSIPPAALESHRTVEVRLHQVPQLPLSCYVRAFINQPDANAQTPMQENAHYAGYLAIFGHGQCYGGPGHCDIPPDQPAPFDLREQTLHNRPRNHRIDVTACVDQLIKNGARDFEITLVVVGVDGHEINNLLRLDSVSLNFKD